MNTLAHPNNVELNYFSNGTASPIFVHCTDIEKRTFSFGSFYGSSNNPTSFNSKALKGDFLVYLQM